MFPLVAIFIAAHLSDCSPFTRMDRGFSRVSVLFFPSLLDNLSLSLSWYPSSCSSSFFFFRMTMRKVFSVPGVFPLTLSLSCVPTASALGRLLAKASFFFAPGIASIWMCFVVLLAPPACVRPL